MRTAVVVPGCRIASQHVIPAHLVWREDSALRQMRSEVYSTQLPLHGPNLGNALVDLCLCNRARGKQDIELAFLLNELSA